MSITKVDPIEKYLEFYKNKTDPEREKRLNSAKELFEQGKNSINEQYKTQLQNLSKDRADLERELLVQSIINKRQIAENNQNLGLTDSGLNRSQQTAVNMSYQNSMAKAKQNYNSDKAALNAKRLQDISNLNTDAAKEQNDINDYFDNMVYKNAINTRADDLTAAAKQTDSDKNEQDNYIKSLTAGINKAKDYGSAYLYNYIHSQNLTAEQLELLKVALRNAGVPENFYERYKQSYQNLQLVPGSK